MSLSRFSQAVFMRNDMSECNLSFCGTCFLLEYMSRLFALTAWHVVRPGDPQNLFIGNFTMYGDRLPMCASFEEPGRTENDNSNNKKDYTDYFVVEIDRRSMTPLQIAHTPFYSINIDELAETPREGDPLVVFGFPAHRQDVDYDRRAITSGVLSITGKYLNGPAADRHIGTIAFDDVDLTGVQFNLMSGSPVFLLRNGNPYLTGMAVRASVEWKIMHFVNCDVLRTIIGKKICQ